jgi:hypothetical protein
MNQPPATRPPFWFKLSIRMGNMIQIDGLILGCALLLTAGQVAHLNPAVRVILMLAGWFLIYICSHALAHWTVGRLGRIGFDGYGVRGTDHPENYPPGARQVMSAMPTFTVMTEKTSMKKARPLARALMFAAGETSTTVCSILAGWYAWSKGIPGGLAFFIAMVVWNVASTFITARVPKGDYAKAIQALQSRKPKKH